ncbi:hypothetical protein MASR2M74_02800 [Paracoccaceae bacterium]
MVDRHHPGKAPTALLQKLSGGLCLTIDQLAEDLDLTNRQVSDAAANLLRRNYLERMAVGCYQLTPEGLAAAAAGEVIKSGPKGPRQKVPEYKDTFRQRAWSSMRMQRMFTVPSIILEAARPSDRNPEDNLHRYLQALVRVEYVAASPHRAAAPAPTSNGYKRFQLRINTGPRAPVVLSKAPGIRDFNTGEDVLCTPR